MNGIGAILTSVILLLAVNVFIFFWVGWWKTLRVWASHTSPIPFTPRKLVPWNFVELLVGILVFIFVSLFFNLAVRTATSATSEESVLTTWDNTVQIGASGAAMLIGALLVGVVIALVSHAQSHDFGLQDFSLSQAWKDIQIGFVAFAMFSPIVFALQAILVQGLGYKYEHPLIEKLLATPDLLLFAVVAISAAVVAPLAEEFLFRVVLQGWLEKVFSLFSRKPESDLVAVTLAIEPLAPAVNPLSNPYTYFSPVVKSVEPSLLMMPQQQRSWPAIVISSLIFGLLHYSHGPAWIPLTILALALGYLYQQTHRILPCIVVHALLNGVTVLQLALQMIVGDTLTPGK